MGGFTWNLRYGLRMLGKNPGFTAAALLCLGLGIGATTASFSVVNAVLLRQLPDAHAERLVRVLTEFPSFPNGGLRRLWVAPPEYLDLKRDSTGFQAVEGWANLGANLAGASEPVRSTAGYVTGGLLPLLGVTPVLGRLLSPQDDSPNAPLTAVLSYGLWQRALRRQASLFGPHKPLHRNACPRLRLVPP